MKCYSVFIKYGVGWGGLFSGYFEVVARFRERCSFLLSTLLCKGLVIGMNSVVKAIHKQ